MGEGGGSSPYLGQGHLALLLGLAAFFPALRWLLHTRLFQPASRRLLEATLLTPAGKPAPDVGAGLDLKVEKLCECLWKLFIYTVFFAMGIAALWGQGWLLDAQQLWAGWPHHDFTLPMQVLYNSELAFYFSSIFTIIFWEVRRKDFAVMFTHHVITVALLAASMKLSFWRVGCLVMALHDACDILMEAAKAFNYTRCDAAATAAFAAFALAWAGLRLTYYPAVVVRGALVDLPGVLDGTPPMWWGFVSGLSLLLCLHVYWFSLILRVAWAQLVTGDGRDVREDDD